MGEHPHPVLEQPHMLAPKAKRQVRRREKQKHLRQRREKKRQRREKKRQQREKKQAWASVRFYRRRSQTYLSSPGALLREGAANDSFSRVFYDALLSGLRT